MKALTSREDDPRREPRVAIGGLGVGDQRPMSERFPTNQPVDYIRQWLIVFIYFWWVSGDRISMLLVYPKSEQDDLTPDQLKQLKQQLAP